MKSLKSFSFIIFSIFFVLTSFNELNAKHHTKRVKHTHKSRSSSFSLNLGINPIAALFGYQYVTPPVYERTVLVTPPPVIEQRIYSTYPAHYREEVIIQRPYTERVYVYPQAQTIYYY